MAFPSDVARTELIQFLRDSFKRPKLEELARTFCPSVHRSLRWELRDDVWDEFVNTADRHGVVDGNFFIGLYLYCPGRHDDIRAIAQCFGVDPEILHSVSRLLPSVIWRHRLILVVVSAAIGIVAGVFLRAMAVSTSRTPEYEISDFAADEEFTRGYEMDIAECYENYGQASRRCETLEEALQSIVTPVDSGSKGKAGRKSPKAVRALKDYRDGIRAENDILRQNYQECGINLRTARIKLEDCASAEKKPWACQLEKGPKQSDGRRRISCTLTKATALLLNPGREATVYECRSHADDGLMPVRPSKSR